MRLGRCLAAFLIFASAASEARAGDELPLVLEWEAPGECYSEGEIRAELARIAHVRPDRVPSRLSARGRIEKQGDSYRLSLVTERNGVAGERNLVASDCRALGREVTLVLALAFGEGIELVPDDEPPRESEATPTKSTVPPKTNPAVKQATSNRDAVSDSREAPLRARSRRTLFAGAGALFRALPGAALQAFVGGELGGEYWWFGARAVAVPRVRDSLERGVEARYDALGGALSPCAGSSLVAACGVFSAMAVRGRSSGASESGSATAPWYAAGAALSLSLPESSAVAARLEASLLFSLNQPRFVVGGLGDTHELPRLVPGISLSSVLGRR